MKKSRDTALIISPDYRQFIEELKARVVSARVTATRAITHEAILLYWDIGRAIVEKQKQHPWGESVIEQVSTDLLNAFPGSTGYSPRNLRSARQLYLAYSDPAIWLQPVAKLAKQVGNTEFRLQPVAKLAPNHAIEFLRQIVAEIPWGQNLLILNKLTEPAARLWYLRATARFGWSRNVLLNQIKGGAYEQAVTEKKTHNFDLALPEHFAEQADEMLKSSYSLDFLGLGKAVKERELEDRLVSRLQAFLKHYPSKLATLS
jgi:predicted nuclease of restriction endonuclease-like (RecB) superfamily